MDVTLSLSKGWYRGQRSCFDGLSMTPILILLFIVAFMILLFPAHIAIV